MLQKDSPPGRTTSYTQNMELRLADKFRVNDYGLDWSKSTATLPTVRLKKWGEGGLKNSDRNLRVWSDLCLENHS